MGQLFIVIKMEHTTGQKLQKVDVAKQFFWNAKNPYGCNISVKKFIKLNVVLRLFGQSIKSTGILIIISADINSITLIPVIAFSTSCCISNMLHNFINQRSFKVDGLYY